MKKEIKKSVIEYLENIHEDTSRIIAEGKRKKLSSTGTPMNKLNGAALYTARRAAIGGGSKASGGGGMEFGDRVLDANRKAKAVIKIIELISKNNSLDNKNHLIDFNKRNKKIKQDATNIGDGVEYLNYTHLDK